MSNALDTTWTEDRVNVAKQLWGVDGVSAQKIANQLGGVSRNAVIGKMNRLGVPKSDRVCEGYTDRRQRKPRQSTAVWRPKSHVVGNLALAEREELFEAETLAIEQYANRKTLMELSEHTCRWPVGDPATPEFFFCGNEPANELPYCTHHCRVAYRPASREPVTIRPKKIAKCFL